MASDKLRRKIAFEAARLMYFREETQYHRAKLKAGRRLSQGWIRPGDMPSNREVRQQIQLFARVHEGHRRDEDLRDMRFEALRMMRLLRRYRPRLTGEVLSGHARDDSEIEIHVFGDADADVAAELTEQGLPYRLEHRAELRRGQHYETVHVHAEDRYRFRLVVHPEMSAREAARRSAADDKCQWASIRDVEELLARDYGHLSASDSASQDDEPETDRFERYASLLWPLEEVKQDPRRHPEGDALYHSLQVFELARDRYPYDEEFLLAALLHDVGKAIDRYDHVAAGLEALDGFITPRTAWLIRHHTDGVALRNRTLGVRSRRRLEQSENFEELMALVECDRLGRQRGVEVPEVEEAIDYVRQLAAHCDL